MAGVKGMHKRASTSPAIAQAIRARIQAGVITDRLTKHALGEVDMAPSAVTAGLGLLKKVVPDMTSTEHSGQFDGKLEILHKIA
jgi:hypothetical protein